MTTTSARAFVAVVFAVAISAGCSGGGAPTRTTTSPRPGELSESDRAAIARAKADSAIRPYTKADVDFMSNMIAHHAQAITISRWAPSHGANSSIRILAERIINSQEDDIVLMRQWLRDRLQPIPDATSHSHHAHHMPGMLTEAQLRELDEARGTEFDRLFLIYMIQHHLGAVAMVKELFDTHGAGQDRTVFKFASDVNVDQSTEIARMEKMLAELQP